MRKSKSKDKSRINSTEGASGRERRKLLSWVLSEIHIADAHYLPLSLILMLAGLAKIYFPILMMSPLLKALLEQRTQAAWREAMLLVGGIFLISLLERALAQRQKAYGSLIGTKLRKKMQLHVLEVDYETAMAAKQKEKFSEAMSGLDYEIGGFITVAERFFSILTYLLRFSLAVGISLTMLLSRPGTVPSLYLVKGEKDIHPILLVLASPVGSLVSALVVGCICLFFAKSVRERTAEKKRTYLKEHVRVEANLAYHVGEVGSAVKNYALYQLYDMLPLLRRRLTENLQETRSFFENSGKVRGAREVVNSATGGVLLFLAYGLVGLKVITGAVALSSLVTYVSSFNQLNLSLNEFAETWTLLQTSMPYLRDVKSYMEIGNRYQTGTIPVEKRRDHEVTFTFENVSFRYPGSKTWALRHINLTLDMHTRHALVGPNGSGKTTFILLLCRLYEPDEGRILLNGIDIRKYDYEEYLSLFAVVFQDYQLFAFPLAENVACAMDYSPAKVRECLATAGFDHPLQEKDGTNLLTAPLASMSGGEERYSGGEQQKIAIARALYKDSSVVVLDEPTAALDPLSEAEIYQSLNELVEDKTAIFISHRMSSCRFCKDILVFAEGRMVQRGRHEKLVAKEGLYQKMWQAQAKYYQA